MAKPILPTASSLVTAAIDAIVADRPESLQHFNNPNSNWGNLPAMWRAQALLLLAWLGDSAKSARLKFAKGQALRALCASEFQTQLPPNPQTALGSVTLSRASVSGGQGVIRAGTAFTKVANPTAVPVPISAGTYTTSSTTYVSPSALSVTLALVAKAPGSAANLPVFAGYSNGGLIVPSRPLFDPTFTWSTDPAQTGTATASGGSDGLPDSALVAAAKAYAVGQYGPTQGALLAGLLRQQSVRRVALFPASQGLPYSQAYVADQSWAQSPPWLNLVSQGIVDAWQGFGCRTRFGLVTNRQIVVAPTIVLNSTDDLNYTDAIDGNVRAAAESYFNDRPDWYRWRTSTLQALLSVADSRIRQCSAVVVSDALTGLPIAETPNTFGVIWAPQLTHMWLTDQNCTSTYLPPT